MKQNPTGNEESSTLLLIAFYEPWCHHSQTLLETMEEASTHLQSYFDSFILSESSNHSHKRLKRYNRDKPILAKIDTTNLSLETQSLLQIREVEQVPFLQFILMEQDGAPKLENITPTAKDTKDPVRSIEYIGPQETYQDILETVLFHWCRMILSKHLNQELVFYHALNASEMEREDGVTSLNEFLHLVPQRPVFPFLDVGNLSDFMSQFGELVFQHPILNIEAKTVEEEQYIHQLLKTGKDETEIQEDPFFAFIQCRSHIPTLALKQEYGKSRDTDKILASFGEFDDMAQAHMYRRDIAFFTIISESCDWMAQQLCDGKNDRGWNGSVRVARVSYDSESGKWDGLDYFLQENGAYFNPLHDEMEDVNNNDDRSISKRLNMTQFTITQSTPSFLWFDKATKVWAFPMYREVHTVLFIDLHSPQTSTGIYNISSTAYRESRHAIASLQKASFYHRRTRPTEDVVFLIVPSTEVQIMNTFGIDIWTQMDEKCQQTNDCFVRDIPTLPTVMITSRRGNHSNNMRRYYLPSSEIRTDDNTSHSSKIQKSDTISFSRIRDFLSDYFDESLSPAMKSEPTPEHSFSPTGVQVVTGNSFHKLVMESQRHALVQFYSPSCGHCQRFQIIWRQVSQLIHTLHWDSIIDVLAMDMTKNEILHEKVDVRQFPSVYFFPLGEKDHPHQLKAQRGSDGLEEFSVEGINSGTMIIEWMLELGELDEFKLKEMALNK